MKIPVTGDLSEPDIKISQLVQKASINAVTKLVASPFKLLGSLIPGGKTDLDLTKVKFEASKADILPLEKAKLDALATALKERPKLKLEITGRAEAQTDMQIPLEEDAEPLPLDPVGLKKLATARADAVYQLLLSKGIIKERLQKVVPLQKVSSRKRKPFVKLKLIK